MVAAIRAATVLVLITDIGELLSDWSATIPIPTLRSFASTNPQPCRRHGWGTLKRLKRGQLVCLLAILERAENRQLEAEPVVIERTWLMLHPLLSSIRHDASSRATSNINLWS